MDYIENLISEAIKFRKLAYTPYSHFQVGAALLTSSGKMYGGFNIENSAYSVCNCAERTALFRGVFDGFKEFKLIAVVGGREGENTLTEYCPPCGMCRQALREFCNPAEFKVILAKSIEDFKIFSLEDLLPESFGPDYL